MNTVETAGVYDLSIRPGGTVHDVSSGEPFPASLYSRMKYGDREATRTLASQLAVTLQEAFPVLVSAEDEPQFLVAYKAVPPACYYLSKYCLEDINTARADAGLAPGTIGHIYKSKVTATNYAAASQAERQKELDGIGFSVPHDVASRPVGLVDDIRITGAAERRILEVLKQSEPSLIMLGYVAIFDPHEAAARPSIEDELNRAAIRHLDQLLPSMQAHNFDLNIRTLKWILGAPAQELEKFLIELPEDILLAVSVGTIATGEEFIRQYSSGYKRLCVEIDARGLA